MRSGRRFSGYYAESVRYGHSFLSQTWVPGSCGVVDVIKWEKLKDCIVGLPGSRQDLVHASYALTSLVASH